MSLAQPLLPKRNRQSVKILSLLRRKPMIQSYSRALENKEAYSLNLKDLMMMMIRSVWGYPWGYHMVDMENKTSRTTLSTVSGNVLVKLKVTS